PTPTLCPYTTLFRSDQARPRERSAAEDRGEARAVLDHEAVAGERVRRVERPVGLHVADRRVVEHPDDSTVGQVDRDRLVRRRPRSGEHTSELQSLTD